VKNAARPQSGPLAELTEEEFQQFVWNLGLLSFNAIYASAFARHKGPLNTIKDYLDVMPGDPRPMALAKEYLKDLTKKMPTETFSLKWLNKSSRWVAYDASMYLSERVQR
jgi:hypothetical protein